MLNSIVFTLTGPDRVGIVEEVTRAMVDVGANVETSRMARLGGEFAIIMMATLPGPTRELTTAFASLESQGYHVSFHEAAGRPQAHDGWRHYAIEVTGADHEGIVHDIAAGLSGQGISIESMETMTTEAPVSGAPLFSMRAVVIVPPALDEGAWTAALAEAAAHANVDVEIVAA